MQKKKQGISLIVLVITIIVMIIIAGAIIISLNNNGVMNNAQDAVDKTNEKQVQEIANLAWGEAYADGKREVSDLQAAVENALKANNLNPEDYYIKVTEKGVTIVNGWIQKANRTVVKGDTVLNIGDTINYDETNGGTITGLTNVDWKVLGAENGELLIMSTSDIASKTFNSEKTFEVGKQACENGITELNELCEPYGKGEYALGARSITVEDVDRVTGYDKTTYGTGEVYEYGNVVTYKYRKSAGSSPSPSYECSNGLSGTLHSFHENGGFHWYDAEKGWQSVSTSDLRDTANFGKEIINLTSTSYRYYGSKATDLKTESPAAYNMLFDTGYGGRYYNYWLASPSVRLDALSVSFGLFSLGNDFVCGGNIVFSYGGYNDISMSSSGVRAVVILSSDFSI